MSDDTGSLRADIDPVLAFQEAHQLPGLVDVHTHFMPKRVMDKVWAYFDSAGPLTAIEWPIAYKLEEDVRLQRLRSYGVVAFTSLVYPHKAGMAEWLNQWAADFAARTPDCLHTATFYPEEGVEKYVTSALESGVRVFKSHIQVGDYDPLDPLLDGAWGALADSRTPVVIHCGSGPAPGRYTGAPPIAELMKRHPRLRLIIAHMGMPEYSDFLALAEAHETLLLDTTMAFTDFLSDRAPLDRRDLPRLRALGDRILFGSDFPNIPYPYVHALEILANLELGDDWIRAVCYDNGARVFSLAV
ncbi:amidohydrolase family protein [Hoyosella altamirensis]|uniref:Amidohydrolase-related domain-containing protein n=1 Tax=Hoyosella altamirensis TaxID=616997 RepID=A0A839RKA2_9ACTN|nr:amidohydrolase family protein [Hoyosella altamirensis]MBB3036827.1 hypothetical protein [Hoyosella altamirensis]